MEITPDDLDDHYENTDKLIHYLYSLRLYEKYDPPTIALALVKIASLMAVRCGMTREQHMGICGNYFTALQNIINQQENIEEKN